MSDKAGFSLVEIMISILILAILALGGSAMMHRAGSGILVQGKKKVALELADLRLEVARAQFYYDIAEDYGAGNEIYLSDTDGDGIMEISDSKVLETITLAGIDYTLFTEVTRWETSDVNNPNPHLSSEHLEIAVVVEYRSDTGETAVLKGVRLPPEV